MMLKSNKASMVRFTEVSKEPKDPEGSNASLMPMGTIRVRSKDRGEKKMLPCSPSSMRFYDLRRAAMAVVLLVSVSGAQQRRRVGYFIFGSNLGNLPVSQNERIECAFSHAMENFPCDAYEHVYFASGKTAPGVEAYYIRDALLELYAEQDQPKPTIFEEDEAKFTVDNVLKTLTMINEQSDLDHVYMVSSDYHLDRAAACYRAFSELGLCRYPFKLAHLPREKRRGAVLMQRICADHEYGAELDQNPIVGTEYEEEFVLRKGPKALHTWDGTYLNGEVRGDQSCLCGGNHATNVEQIRCPARDKSNSDIFARYINLMKRKQFILVRRSPNDPWLLQNGRSLKSIMEEEDIQQYFANNKKVSKTDRDGCFNMFTKFVARFVSDSQKFWYSSDVATPPPMKKQRSN